MKGTEKQIKWASDIIKNIEEVMNDMEEMNSNRPEIKQVKALHQKIMANIKKEDAGNIINDFKEMEVKTVDGAKQVVENYKNFANQMMIAKKMNKRDYRA